ncbi:uncharacterized protein OCT59_007275 [Rhizophagus irregularis]|uniref:uncharacterized protein n=1 Tax=Rhizophagus irregularis TaxID=588596 RepID=UPI0033263813|nr:hypothetical protein OCT59_007275 [Rhizophagus irregularis]
MQDDQLRNLILQDSDELLAIRKISKYFPKFPPFPEHIHVIVKLPLLSLEEALSCIPPPITYSPNCTKSKTTTKVNGDPPTRVQLWGDFFELCRLKGTNDSHTLRSHSKSSSNSSLNQQQSSSTFANQQSSSNTSVKQNNYSFSDFKFKSILGERRSGKTLLCEFCGDMIALKSADLSKTPSYVLEEMQKEVEICKDLADIQDKYISKLVCYGYYGGGIRSDPRHGIHNDIREENILINDDGGVYLIDFGMASQEDTKKKRKLFEEEQLKYSNLLDRYNIHFVKKEGRISKSRKCQVVS